MIHKMELPVRSENEISISPLQRRNVQCVGSWFISLWQNENEKDCSLSEEQVSDDDNDSNSGCIDEDDVGFLRSLDPKEWKHQDHYAVIGLSKLRHRATEDDIRKAYRIKVLRHHPDKRKAQGEEIRPDDDYFTCITKAWEILGNPRTRRSYDSVDPLFDDTIPSSNDYSKTHFFKVFTDVFETNSRWSEKLPVPKLGGPTSTKEQVEKFYNFWYNFESWRDFSYLDEEEKEKGQDRDERKWIEKQNKVIRVKRKKEEMTRIRTLVDLAYNLDPRVAKIKQEEKDRKIAFKQARKDAARARYEEAERIAREAEEQVKKAKKEEEAKEKAKANALKAERETQKRALKKERSNLRKLAKANNYYISNDSELVQHMSSLEKICESFPIEELVSLVERLSITGREGFLEAKNIVESRIEMEREALLDQPTKNQFVSGIKVAPSAPGIEWTPEELQLLIKAVNLFPAGTAKRWEVVANFINQHSQGVTGGATRTAKEVLAQAKTLQGSDYSKNILKSQANQNAYDNLEHKRRVEVDSKVVVTERFDGPGVDGVSSTSSTNSSTPWTTSEQQLLEQALKTYPASYGSDRWDRIAECIPNRSRRECMRRYKELVEMIRAKKAAQAAASGQELKTKNR